MLTKQRVTDSSHLQAESIRTTFIIVRQIIYHTDTVFVLFLFCLQFSLVVSNFTE